MRANLCEQGPAKIKSERSASICDRSSKVTMMVQRALMETCKDEAFAFLAHYLSSVWPLRLYRCRSELRKLPLRHSSSSGPATCPGRSVAYFTIRIPPGACGLPLTVCFVQVGFKLQMLPLRHSYTSSSGPPVRGLLYNYNIPEFLPAHGPPGSPRVSATSHDSPPRPA